MRAGVGTEARAARAQSAETIPQTRSQVANRLENRELKNLDIVWEQVCLEGRELSLQAVVTLKTTLPDQDEQLPNRAELVCEDSGQELKRALYRAIMERADLEAVLSRRAGKDGKGIKRIGTKYYTFKAIFGTVRIRRIRIKHRADGSTEIPSHHIWKTPRQIMITRGLEMAVCNTVTIESYRNTVTQIERRSGEVKLLSKGSVKNILHRNGQQLATEQAARAEAVFQADSSVKKLIGEPAMQLAEDHFEQVFLAGASLEYKTDEEIAEVFEEIDWGSGEFKEDKLNDLINNATSMNVPAQGESRALECPPLEHSPLEHSPPREQIIVEPDEVMISSQEQEGGQYLVHYNAVVRSSERNYYLSAGTAAQLCWQTGSLLAALGVGKAENNTQLLILSDGASWIRAWGNSLGITNHQSILCWYHLNDRCGRLIREAFVEQETRQIVKKTLQKYLWCGQVAAAKKYLRKLSEDAADGIGQIQIGDEKALEKLAKYLNVREAMMPNYRARWQARASIASRSVEQFNNHSISARCKRPKVKWTRKGVAAIAALATVARNGESEYWQQLGRLPARQGMARCRKY